MRGSIVYQAQQLLEVITAFGQSKHAAKKASRLAGARSWQQIGSHLDIYSFNTANLYRSVWIDLLRYARQRFALKDCTRLNALVIQAYLESKIAQGLAYRSFQVYGAALEKLAVALCRYTMLQGQAAAYDWSADIAAAKQEAAVVLERTTRTRAYPHPQTLVQAVADPVFRVVAAAQYSSGCRISELDHVRPEQFLGDSCFQVLQGKGGRDRLIRFRHSESYQHYQALVLSQPNPQYNKFTFHRPAYRRTLQRAAQASDQPYTGSHGLRWNYAQEQFTNLQRQGSTREQALVQVSQELGHSRGDITGHYLR